MAQTAPGYGPMRTRLAFLFVVTALLLSIAAPLAAQTPEGDGVTVRGILFFSPTCGHCHKVINEDLPVIYEEYGGQPVVLYDESAAPEDVGFYLMTNGTLELLFVDVSTEAGSDMFVADSEALGLERAGVPRLNIADTYLVGSTEIPEVLPDIIEQGIANGGIPWPNVEGVEDALATIPGADVPANPGEGSDGGEAADVLPSDGDQSVWDRIANDPAANGLAILVLVGMVASLVGVVYLGRRDGLPSGPAWLIPVLAVVGIGVSIYLASVEASGADAVCGPVGDCNAVQQSEYASIFGVPVGVLGIVGYAVLLLGWLTTRFARGRAADWGAVGATGIALGGTFFSIYLTFLEPFVIGATCMWCLTSAVAVTGLLWLTAGPGLEALRRIAGSDSDSRERELTYG